MQRGARDNWVRTGISWTDVPYLDRTRAHPPAQVAALNDLLSGHRAGDAADSTSAPTRNVALGSFGPDEVSLAAAGGRGRDAAGARRRDSPPSTLADPVTLQLDVNAAADHDAHLRLGVPLDGEWYGAARPRRARRGRARRGALAGRRATRWSVTLARPDRAGRPRRSAGCSSRGDSVVVPAADRDDLVAEYLPRLQRHVPVISSDGSVDGARAGRAAARAHGHLGGGRRGADRLDVALPGRHGRPGLRAVGDPRPARRAPPRGRAGAARRAASSTTSRATTCAAGTSAGTGCEDARRSATRTRSCSPSELLPGLRGPGGGRGDRRPAGLPRARRRAGDPLRDAARAPTRTADAHRLARPRGGDHRRRHPHRAGPRARGADQRAWTG